MKTLYIECNMGAAGDMLMAALLELVPDPDEYVVRLNDLGCTKMMNTLWNCTASMCVGMTS